MAYSKIPDFKALVDQLTAFVQLKEEYGARGLGAVLRQAERALRSTLAQVKALRIDPDLARREPDDLDAIRALRPPGPRRLWHGFSPDAFRERLEGALLGRLAGCTLGAPVEAWPVEKMKALAAELGDPFPPIDYWRRVPEPRKKRYNFSPREAYTRDVMNGVPVDDDIAYTLLGLLIVEEYGPDFTTADVAEAWMRYLPIAYTAERVALQNLEAGVPWQRAAERDNPYCEWIGGDIRADPWGYLAPGWPERAAEMAYRDAYLSHRRQGIYGAMFFAATISAAFTVDDSVDALEIGLTAVPRGCALAKAIRWALTAGRRIKDYRQARKAVDERFQGMSSVHTVNNACLTVFGLMIGRSDVTRVIGETVAMGMDNDCTAATAGSIVGAVVGKGGVPDHWHRRFNNTVHSYLKGKRRFTIRGLVRRFSRQAALIHQKWR